MATELNPVPPEVAAIAVPVHVPVVIVPKVVIVDCPTYDDEMSIAFAETEILFVVPTTSIVLPVFVKPLPALICPAPENCSNAI